MIEINQTQECAELAARLWLWEGYDSLHFFWKWMNPITVNEVPQKLDAWRTKNTFLWVDDNTIVT